MKFGGIYLDRDVIIIQSLDNFRRYEMTLDFEKPHILGNQVQIAHKRARFLRLYLRTYQKYDGTKWYYNAGHYPVEKIVNKYPHLVHRLNGEFGLKGTPDCRLLYLDNFQNWRQKYYAIHLLLRENSIRIHYRWCFGGGKGPKVLDFDELVVKTLNTTFGQMARFILYNTTQLMGTNG